MKAAESVADHFAESIELLIDDVDDILGGRGPMSELRAKLRRLKSGLGALLTEAVDLGFEGEALP